MNNFRPIPYSLFTNITFEIVDSKQLSKNKHFSTLFQMVRSVLFGVLPCADTHWSTWPSLNSTTGMNTVTENGVRLCFLYIVRAPFALSRCEGSKFLLLETSNSRNEGWEALANSRIPLSFINGLKEQIECMVERRVEKVLSLTRVYCTCL